MSTVTNVYPHYVSPSTAAQIFSVSLQTLRRWSREGKIGYIRTPGGRFRYDVAGLIVAAGPARPSVPVAAPKPKKPAKAPKKPVQHQNEPGVVLQAQTPVQASVPAPEPESPCTTLLEPLAAMPAPKPERITPKAPLGADALRSQFSSLAGASRW
jgi:excisionase family DNA binding protein